MDDAMSSSSDESDIGELFQKAAEQQKRRPGKHNRSTSLNQRNGDDSGDGDDSSDDSSDDSGPDIQLYASRNRRRKHKETTEDKLQAMAQRQARCKRNQQQTQRDRLRRDSMESSEEEDYENRLPLNSSAKMAHDIDSSDDDDSDCVVVSMARLVANATNYTPTAPTATQSRAPLIVPPSAAQTVVPARRVTRSQSNPQSQNSGACCGMTPANPIAISDALARKFTPQPTAVTLGDIHRLKAKLVNNTEKLTNHRTGPHSNTSMSSTNHVYTSDCQDYHTTMPQRLELIVQATIHDNLTTTGGSSDDRSKGTIVQCTVSAFETDLVQTVSAAILRKLNLNPATHVAGLRYDGRTLRDRHGLDLYALPVPTATLQAVIFSSGAAAASGKKAAAKAITGPKLSVTVRWKSDTIPLSVGMREPLQALVQRFASHVVGTKLPADREWGLSFDGDTLDLRKPPPVYELESGDLIDVVLMPL